MNNNTIDDFLENFIEIEKKLKKSKIIIFMGGFGEERDASLYSGKAVSNELLQKGWNIEIIDPSINTTWLQEVDSKCLAFNCLHGIFGESGHLPSILDYLKIKYTFSDSYASIIAFDKLFFKSIVHKLNLKVPIDNYDDPFKTSNSDFFIHKKIRGGGSFDLIMDTNKNNTNNSHFTEEFIPGKILTMGVLESNHDYIPLSIVEIVMKGSKFYDQKAKYEEGFCEYKLYDGDNIRKISKEVVKICKFLNIKGGARFDFIESKNKDEVYFLEINNVPGLYSSSNFIFSASGLKLSFYQVLVWLLNNAKYNKL